MGVNLCDLVHWPNSFGPYGVEVAKCSVEMDVDGGDDESKYVLIAVLRQHAAQWQNSSFDVQIYDDEGFALSWSGWADVESSRDPTQIRLRKEFWCHEISRIEVTHYADPLPEAAEWAEVGPDSNDGENDLERLELLRTVRPNESITRRAIANSLDGIVLAQPSLGPLVDVVAGLIEDLPSAPDNLAPAPRGASEPNAPLNEQWDPEAAVAWYAGGKNYGAQDCTAAAQGVERAFGDQGWKVAGLRLWWEPGFSPSSFIGMSAVLEWQGGGQPTAPWVNATVYDPVGRLDKVSDVSPWSEYDVPEPVPREVAYSDTIGLSLSGADSVPGRVVFSSVRRKPEDFAF